MEIERDFQFGPTTAEWDAAGASKIRSTLTILTPGRDPPVVVLAIEAQVSPALAGAIDDANEFLLEILFERFRAPLPQRNDTDLP